MIEEMILKWRVIIQGVNQMYRRLLPRKGKE
jgi:hypothetical protein